MNDFFTWMNSELDERGWSYNELARRAGFSSGTVSMVMTGKNKVSWEFCAGIAEAFGLPAEDVFRQAGLLRPVPDPHGVQQLVDVAQHLTPDNLADLTSYARYRYKQQIESETT